MEVGEVTIIILIVVLIIIGVIIIVVLNNIERNEKQGGSSSKSGCRTRAIAARLSIAPTPTTTSSIVSPQIFITGTPTGNNLAPGEIGSSCGSDGECHTQNCSNGFCQSNGAVTGQDGAFCLVGSSPSCQNRFECRNSMCQPVGADLFEPCTDLNDCQPFYTCSTSPLDSSTNRVCQFPFDPNSCVTGVCSGGHQCVNGRCVGQSGSPCTIDGECLNICGTQSISRWKNGRWTRHASIPSNVRFSRLMAITRNNDDDIWGLDPNNGLYYWKHDNPAQTWIKVLDGRFDMNMNRTYMIQEDRPTGDLNGYRTQRSMELIDLAIVHAEAIYLLFRAGGVDIATGRSRRPVYPIYRLNMFRMADGSTSTSVDPGRIRSKLIPFNTEDGIQQTEDGDTFADIIGIDAVMDNGRTLMSIYGRCRRDGDRYYTFSMPGNDSCFQYSGPSHGSGLGPNNLIRMVRDLHSTSYKSYDRDRMSTPGGYRSDCGSISSEDEYDYDDYNDYSDQGRLYNYLEFSHDSEGRRTSSLAINGHYPGSHCDSPIPYNDNLLIYDYFPLSLDDKIVTYLIANDRTSGRTNLYVAPDAAEGTVYTLPGYVSSQTRVSATENGVYLYSPGTCT